MFVCKNKEETGYSTCTDGWAPYRGIYPEPTPQELKLIEKFLLKFVWEDNDFDENSRDRWISLKNRLQCPNLRDLLRKFIRQVRGSKGYDVDLNLDFIRYPYTVFVPRNLNEKKYYDEAMAAAKFAIQEINSATKQVGKTYELVSVDKLVSASYKEFAIINMLLLTFTAKNTVADSDAVSKTTFQAMIKVCDQDQPPSSFLLKEWKYKPILIE